MVCNGRLRGCERVGMLRIQFEQRAAILQVEPVFVHHDTRSEAQVHALDQRHDIAVAIDHRKINGVARRYRGLARRGRAVGLAAIDQRGALARVALRDQPGRGRLREARVGHIAAQILVGQLLRFDLEVQVFQAGWRVVEQGKRLEDVEHLQRRDALAVGRQLIHLPSAIFGGDRLDPFGLELRQVFGGHLATQAGRGLQDGVRDVAFIKRGGALGGNQLIRRGQMPVAEDLPNLREARLPAGRCAARRRRPTASAVADFQVS